MQNLYNNVTYLYPDATIWLTGHSLGGSLAALLGATFGVPVVAFEAPGDKLPATRLHLPQAVRFSRKSQCLFAHCRSSLLCFISLTYITPPTPSRTACVLA